MKDTKIQWATHTYNPWMGCRKVAPECENCYIVRQTPLRVRNIKHGSQRHRCSPSTLRQPLRWNAQAELELAAGTMRDRPRVFCLSLGDWLDNEVDTLWLADLLEMIDATKNLDWLLLTKRPQNWFRRLKQVDEFRFDKDVRIPHAAAPLASRWLAGQKPENVWIGVSAGADQRAALDIPAKIHFLSCEPMLYPLELRWAAQFDWIIFGGESGPEARASDIAWIKEGIEFCGTRNITPFVKQLGRNPYSVNDYTPSDSTEKERVTHFLNLKDPHGGDMAEWPADLRVRELPTAK